MKTLTSILLDYNDEHPDYDLDASFLHGIDWGRNDPRPMHQDDWEFFSWLRTIYDFRWVRAPRLITEPQDNHKLDLTEMVVYGLTLQSHVVTLADGTKVRTCPKSGRCAKVCVLLNGNGAYPAVQRSRDARTAYFVERPGMAVFHMGFEIGRALRKHGRIGFRPNVNQDVDWHAVMPSITEVDGLTVYGYTKRFPIIVGNQTEAYSLNEQSTWEATAAMLDAGVNVAVVTNRKKGRPVEQWAHKLGLACHKVVDADIDDTWMVAHRGEGVIGDLTAKGKAQTYARTERKRSIPVRGTSTVGRFVQLVY